MLITQIIVGGFIIINAITFLVMLYDKRRSMVDGRLSRIPEGHIFFLAAAFGSVGVYLGMLLIRHKTRHWYFQLGIPLLMIQNAATAYVVWQFILRLTA
jgi:uncharacterized membrane protein YsdA (DUF1294 family)